MKKIWLSLCLFLLQLQAMETSSPVPASTTPAPYPSSLTPRRKENCWRTFVQDPRTCHCGVAGCMSLTCCCIATGSAALHTTPAALVTAALWWLNTAVSCNPFLKAARDACRADTEE